jgi:hypothetical protein
LATFGTRTTVAADSFITYWDGSASALRSVEVPECSNMQMRCSTEVKVDQPLPSVSHPPTHFRRGYLQAKREKFEPSCIERTQNQPSQTLILFGSKAMKGSPHMARFLRFKTEKLSSDLRRSTITAPVKLELPLRDRSNGWVYENKGERNQ